MPRWGGGWTKLLPCKWFRSYMVGIWDAVNSVRMWNYTFALIFRSVYIIWNEVGVSCDISSRPGIAPHPTPSYVWMDGAKRVKHLALHQWKLIKRPDILTSGGYMPRTERIGDARTLAPPHPIASPLAAAATWYSSRLHTTCAVVNGDVRSHAESNFVLLQR